MRLTEIKTIILNLAEGEQRRLVIEVLPEIWPQLAGDEACLNLIRQLLDEESTRAYQQEHLDHL